MKRNHLLDVLKGISILFVIVTHYYMNNEQRIRYLFPFWIDMAVPVFMICSGFLYAKSYDRYHIRSMSEAYHPKCIVPKLVRYTVPFSIAYFLEISVYIISGGQTVKSLVSGFLVGGYGPGSYYYPVMIQFIFIFPIIYFIVKKFSYKGVVICGFINFVYEVLKSVYGVSLSTYRLLVFRYILVIAAGCYMSDVEERQEEIEYKQGLLCFICGSAFLTAYSLGYTPVILKYWTTTSFLACLYIIPIVMVLICRCKVRCRGLELLGRASFNIYLVQMVYYNFLAERIYLWTAYPGLRIVINISICIVAGLVFYLIEKPVTDLVLRWVTPKIGQSTI